MLTENETKQLCTALMTTASHRAFTDSPNITLSDVVYLISAFSEVDVVFEYNKDTQTMTCIRLDHSEEN